MLVFHGSNVKGIMFTSFTYIALFLVYEYCNGQMRPSNWDLDVMRFDQRDWDKFDQDFAQNGRRPFPSFRSNRIPTQQPPIVGQIPGQIGGQGGQRGQSENDNVPPPLPPMPRRPEMNPGRSPVLPPAPLPSDENTGGSTDQSGAPMPSFPDLDPDSPPDDLIGSGSIPGRHGNENQPPLIPPRPGPLPTEPPPDQTQGVEPQSQVPPQMKPPINPDQDGVTEGTNRSEPEIPNQSETPPPMGQTPPTSEEREITSTLQPSTVGPEPDQNGGAGFSFGSVIDDFPGQFGQGSQERFGFSGERDIFPTLQPSEERNPGQIDQRGGSIPMSQDQDLTGIFSGQADGSGQIAASSEQKNVLVPPMGKFADEQEKKLMVSMGRAGGRRAPAPFDGVLSTIPRRGQSGGNPTVPQVPKGKEDSGIGTPQGMGKRNDLEGMDQRMGVAGNKLRPPRGR